LSTGEPRSRHDKSCQPRRTRWRRTHESRPTLRRRSIAGPFKCFGISDRTKRLNSSCLPKHHGDGIALCKRQKPSAIARMCSFGHDFPAMTQHTCHVPIHCLHSWQETLPVVFSGPISLICKRLYCHVSLTRMSSVGYARPVVISRCPRRR
jgi:hypothetical protein